MNNFLSKNMFLNITNRLTIPYVILFIGCMSFFVSIRSIDYLNRDGVMYLIQAFHLNNNQSHIALEIFPYLSYARSIAFLQNITQLTYLQSAHLLNSFLFTITGIFFLLTCKVFVKGRYVLISSALIFISSIPFFDSYLEMIIRDHAYITFLMISIFYLSKYFVEEKRYLYIIISLSSLGVASLFRIESLFYLFVFASYFLVDKIYSVNINLRSKKFNNKMILLTSIFLIFIISFYGINNLNQIFFDLFQILVTPIDLSSNNYWLAELIKDDNLKIKWSILTFIFIIKLIILMGLLNIILLFLGIKYVYFSNIKLLAFLFLLTLIPPAINFLSTYVLSSRYLLSSLIICNIFSVIVLNSFFENQIIIKKIKLLRVFIFAYIFICIAMILIDSKKINYEKQLALWFTMQNINFNEVYSEDERVDYFMNRFMHETHRQKFKDALLDENIKYFLTYKPKFFINHKDFSIINLPDNYNHKKIQVFIRNKN